MPRRPTTTIRPEEMAIGARPEEPELVVLMLQDEGRVHAIDLTVAQAETMAKTLLEEVARRRRLS